MEADGWGMHRGFCITVLRRAVDGITKTMLSEYDLFKPPGNFVLLFLSCWKLGLTSSFLGGRGWGGSRGGGGGRNCGVGGGGVFCCCFTVTLASVHQRFKVNEHV